MNKCTLAFVAVLFIINISFPAELTAAGMGKALNAQIQNPLYLCSMDFAVKCKVNFGKKNLLGITPEETYEIFQLFSAICSMLKSRGYEPKPPCQIGQRVKIGIHILWDNSEIKRVALFCPPLKDVEIRMDSYDLEPELSKAFSKFEAFIRKGDLEKLRRAQIQSEEDARIGRVGLGKARRAP